MQPGEDSGIDARNRMIIESLMEAKKGLSQEEFYSLCLQASDDVFPITDDEIWHNLEMQQRGLAYLLIRILKDRWVFDHLEGVWYGRQVDDFIWRIDEDERMEWTRPGLVALLARLEAAFREKARELETAGQTDMAKTFQARIKTIEKIRFKLAGITILGCSPLRMACWTCERAHSGPGNPRTSCGSRSPRSGTGSMRARSYGKHSYMEFLMEI
jgi:hypothetical protein